MEAKKSNKIRDIVKLQQILKKWRKVAHASKQAKINNVDDNNNNNNNGSGSKGIKFLKRTLSFTDTATAVPKGYLAVSVGKEEKRYKIPTEYLSHQAFHVLTTTTQECRFNATSGEVMSYIRHPSDCPKTPSHQPHSPMCR